MLPVCSDVLSGASSRLGKASICLRFRLLPAPDPFTISPNALQCPSFDSTPVKCQAYSFALMYLHLKLFYMDLSIPS